MTCFSKWLTLAMSVGIAAIAPAASLSASETVLDLDPAKTQVEYRLGSVLHTVEGTFQLTRGQIRFDPETGKASGELVVDATSGASGNGSRDGRMHRSIIESQKYPEIVFRPNRVEGRVAAQGASHVMLNGVFSLHGTDHEMAVPVDVDASGGQYTATAKFQVPYILWGLKNPSTLLLRVSDKVELTIHTVAHRAP